MANMAYVRARKDIVEGEVEGYRYFFNPSGHHGVLVLFGEALDVFNACKNGLRIEEMKTQFAWANGNLDQVERVLNALGEMELIDLGREFSERLHVERRRAVKKVMTVWLQLTDACDLRCDYCCIKKKPTRMGVNMAKQLVEKIAIDSDRAGFKEVLVKIAGGEPTLFWKDAKALIDWAAIRFANTEPKVRFHIITNGTLITPSLIDYLRTGHLGISVSLDGVGKWHDIQRPFVNGKGSFETVDANISKLLAAGIRFNILAVITNKNAGGMTELAQYCLERDLPFRFGFYRETPTFAGEAVGDNEVLIRELKRCYAWIAEHLPKTDIQLLHKLADVKLDGPKTRNCGIGSNSITVGTDGSVNICQYEMDVILGNALETDIVRLMAEQKHYDLDATLVDRVPICKDCAWRYTCGGGCPLLTKQHFGTMGRPSPYCEVYKAVLPVLVELHALQLVRRFQKKIAGK